MEARADEVSKVLQDLGGARWVDAARGRLTRLAHQVGAAFWAFLRHVPGPARVRLFLGQGAHDFGDDVAGALDDDVVARPHVFPRDLVLVVQRRPADRRPPNVDRLEAGHRRDRTGPSHVNLDLVDDRLRLFWRELEGKRPARAAGDETELRLLPEVVDFDHDPVDPVIELVPFLLPLVEKADDGVDVGVGATIRIDVKAHLIEPRQDLRLASGAAGRIERVDEGVEAAPRRDARVELSDGAGGGVARVGEERLAFSGQLGVQPLKAALRHVDLAANLERPGKLRGDRHSNVYDGYGFDVRRHVCADIPVPACSPDLVAAVLVEQAHRQPIDLQLGHV